MRLNKVSILKTFELDFTQPGLPEHITLVDLLSDLSALCKKRLLLIIDEAQHALSSDQGTNCMFSLKSARDQINAIAGSTQLMLVLTGSNRDKLAQLVINKDQPFFGSEITSFPLLNKDFTDYFTDKINHALAVSNQFSKESMWEAFQLVGYRPEILHQLVSRTALNNDAESFSQLLQQDAYIWHSQIWEGFEEEFNILPSLQQIIMMRIATEGQQWSPFSEASMTFYRETSNNPELSVSTVQGAISGLRQRGFIWQSKRGTYTLEDESFGQWLFHKQRDFFEA